MSSQRIGRRRVDGHSARTHSVVRGTHRALCERTRAVSLLFASHVYLHALRTRVRGCATVCAATRLLGVLSCARTTPPPRSRVWLSAHSHRRAASGERRTLRRLAPMELSLDNPSSAGVMRGKTLEQSGIDEHSPIKQIRQYVSDNSDRLGNVA